MSPLLLSVLVFAAAPQPWEAFFPAGTEVGFIWRLDPALEGRRLAFDVAPSGQPFLGAGAVVFPLADRPDRELPPFKLSGISQVDALGFARDGALLLVSGRTLGLAAPSGFRVLATLPGEGFQLTAGAAKTMWLWGGDRVYRLSHGGRVQSVLRAPAAIEALASDGARTVFAMQGALLELPEGGEPRLLAVLPGPARALAFAPGGGLFYSTDREVGFVSPAGSRTPFVRGKGARLGVAGGALFLFFEDEGLLRCAPVERFEAMAAAIEAARKAGPP